MMSLTDLSSTILRILTNISYISNTSNAPEA